MHSLMIILVKFNLITATLFTLLLHRVGPGLCSLIFFRNFAGSKYLQFVTIQVIEVLDQSTQNAVIANCWKYVYKKNINNKPQTTITP